MRKALKIFFVLIISTLAFFSGFSQTKLIKGKISDSETGEPLAFVNIVYNEQNNGTTTDINGNFTINQTTDVKFLKISYVGYESVTINKDEIKPGKTINIKLKHALVNLNEVTVFPGINPAHRIIEACISNRDINNPEKMTSFSYTSYNKMIFTINSDSLKRFDTITTLSTDTSKNDSSFRKMQKFFQKQDLFLIESVSKRTFSYPDKNNEKVIASKVSGFRNEAFSLLATQMQSFSFYKELIMIFDKMYLNPISKGSTKKYFFLIEDTTYSETGDTVFVISFKPKQGKNFEGLKGVLYINSNRYAIQNVIAEPFDQQVSLDIKIQQKYELIDKKQWFPVQLNTDMTFNNAELVAGKHKLKLMGIGKSYLTDIVLNPEVSKSEFGHVELKVDPEATNKSEEFWETYRYEPLSSKDTATYRIVDSVSKAENLEQKIQLIEAIATGNIPLWFLNLEYAKMFSYNVYEGFRTGIGLMTNDKVSEYFSVGGFFGYGFHDKTFKYGGTIRTKFDHYGENFIEFSYINDVEETGGVNFFDDRPMLYSSESYRKIFVEWMNKIERYQFLTGFRTLEYMKVFLFANHSVSSKNSKDTTDKSKYFPFSYTYHEAGFGIRYAFREKYIETTRAKIPMGTDYPIVFANFTLGEETESNIRYFRFDAKATKIFTNKNFGKTSIQLSGGITAGKNSVLPYSLLYAGRSSYFKGLSIECDNSFNTMRLNEFGADRYVSLFINHNFGSLLLKSKHFSPKIVILFHAGIADFDRKYKEYYLHEYKLQTYSKGFYETGLLVNKILTSNFSSIGLGVFYRLGKYAMTKTADNFAYKLTLTFDF